MIKNIIYTLDRATIEIAICEYIAKKDQENSNRVHDIRWSLDDENRPVATATLMEVEIK